jgi:hypothetical protein
MTFPSLAKELTMFKRIALISFALFAFAATGALADAPVKGPFAGTVHAVATINYLDGSQQTWNWDRGQVTSLSSTSITLTRRDKVQVTFTITSSTIVRNDGATYSLSDLQVGQVATVVSQNGNADIIRRIRGDGAPTGGDPSAIDGPAVKSVDGTIDAQYVDGSKQSFDYDHGVITQVANGQLTVTRLDKQTVTLSYGDSTVVRDCHGQVGSTSDLAVGDGGMFFSQNGQLDLAGCLHQVARVHRGAGGNGASASASAIPAGL